MPMLKRKEYPRGFILSVCHKGVFKYVGRCHPHPLDSSMWIFFHEERKASQRYRNLRSPGGIDSVVLDFLEREGIERVYHAISGSEWIWTATVAEIREYGARRQEDGRDRWFLPEKGWTKTRYDWESPYCHPEHKLSPGDD